MAPLKLEFHIWPLTVTLRTSTWFHRVCYTCASQAKYATTFDSRQLVRLQLKISFIHNRSFIHDIKISNVEHRTQTFRSNLTWMNAWRVRTNYVRRFRIMFDRQRSAIVQNKQHTANNSWLITIC